MTASARAAVLPHDLDAEQAVLGCLLINSEAIDKVRGILSPSDFYADRNGAVFAAAQALAERGEPLDILTLKVELERHGTLASSGGIEYLAELSQKMPTAVSVAHYGRMVLEQAQRREIIDLGGKLSRGAQQLDVSVEDTLRLADRDLQRTRQRVPTAAGGEADGFTLTRLGDLLAEPEERVTWLVPDMMPTGGLVFVAGKPKAGKSTLARALALAVAQGDDFLGRRCAGGTVIYLALEERRSEVRRHFRLMGAEHTDPILVHVAKAPVDGLKALLTLIRKHRPVLVIIDPLLRFTRVKDEKAYAELSNALEGVMAAAREHSVTILATHHAPKATGTEAIDALLGSTALSGAPDTVMVIRRQERERTLATVQRYGIDLEKTVLTLDPATGIVRLAGTVTEAHSRETRHRVLELIDGAEMTSPELVEAADGRRADTLKALAELADEGIVMRSGTGRKGDPYRYRRPSDVIRYAVPDPTLGTAEPNPEMAPNPLPTRDLFGSGAGAPGAAFVEKLGTEYDPFAAALAAFAAATSPRGAGAARCRPGQRGEGPVAGGAGARAGRLQTAS